MHIQNAVALETEYRLVDHRLEGAEDLNGVRWRDQLLREILLLADTRGTKPFEVAVLYTSSVLAALLRRLSTLVCSGQKELDRFGPCESVKIGKEEVIRNSAPVQQERFSPPTLKKTLGDAARHLALSARECLRFPAAERDIINNVCSGHEELCRLREQRA